MPELKKLPKTAYELKEGEVFVPFTQGQNLKEFTLKAAIVGILLGIVFGAANVYLGLKAGLTISTSIPVAVLTVVVFRLIGGNYSILETNMSQTIGSASSSVASGVLFTLPALFIWGMKPGLWQLTGLSMAGGILGVLAMIPLRRYLIKQEHGRLPFPEGTACAEVQVAAYGGGKQAEGVFWGIGAGMIIKILTSGLKLIPESLSVGLIGKAQIAIKVSPALAGVGYILGLRISTIMVAGSALSSLVMIPIINLWGADLTAPFFPETEKLIRDMSAGDLWERYIRYIGAGAVAAGGIITLIQSLPSMVESFKVGIAQLKKSKEGAVNDPLDTDISLKTLVSIGFLVLATLAIVPGFLGYIDTFEARCVAALLIGVFAFFFVTVASRIVGMVGVTSNPTSGMTIATLIGTSLIFYFLGWTDMAGKATALMVGTAVCIAASIAGDTSQDLKTGYVLGASPRSQQWGELLGVITSSGVICLVLVVLDKSLVLGSADLPAPQANLMKLVIDGVLDQQLPWNLVFIGMGISVVVFLCRLPPLAFAVGVYLPMSTMAAVFLGGVLRHAFTRKQEPERADQIRENGVLFGSGMVGGEGLTGVVFALWVFISNARITGLESWRKSLGASLGDMGFMVDSSLAVVGLIGLAWVMRRFSVRPS